MKIINKQQISFTKDIDFLVPATSYNLCQDTRLLIPFVEYGKIGFADNAGTIIVEPKYTMCHGDIYQSDDIMKVALIYTYGFPRKSGEVTTYHRLVYGLINYQGVEIIKPMYLFLLPSVGGTRLLSVADLRYQYAVLNLQGEEVIPFGRYTWIDGFSGGLTRVIRYDKELKKEKWGIINEKGEEVLPVEYDKIWNFYDKNIAATRIEKNGEIRQCNLAALREQAKFSY